MITSEDLGYVLDQLTEQDVEKAQELDRFKIEHLISNSGSVVRLGELEEDETEEDITDNGNLVLDFDELCILFNESGSLNPFLIEIAY